MCASLCLGCWGRGRGRGSRVHSGGTDIYGAPLNLIESGGASNRPTYKNELANYTKTSAALLAGQITLGRLNVVNVRHHANEVSANRLQQVAGGGKA